MRYLSLFGFMILGFYIPVMAQVRSPEIEAFLADARSLTDEARKLRTGVQDYFKETGRWEPKEKDKEFWTAVDRLASGAELCERRVDRSSNIPEIEESILQVFIRMGQLNDTSTSVQVDRPILRRLRSAKSIVANMEKKYIARKKLDPNWELRGGKIEETDPETVAQVTKIAQRFLSHEYGYSSDSIQNAHVTRLGVYHLIEVQTKNTTFKMAINSKQGLVIMERHYSIH